jgi:hypothetical protein
VCVCIHMYVYLSRCTMVGVIALIELVLVYCLNDKSRLVLSFVCTYAFVLFPYCVRNYFVIGI